jgi:hypothetical protein
VVGATTRFARRWRHQVGGRATRSFNNNNNIIIIIINAYIMRDPQYLQRLIDAIEFYKNNPNTYTITWLATKFKVHDGTSESEY